jgi:F-type H+-transporting ATPase subunit epsilon
MREGEDPLGFKSGEETGGQDMSIHLVVVTPQGEAFAGPVDEVVLPGASGEFGVLENHERFLSALDHGCMEIRTQGGSRFSAVSSGFAEVTGEKVVVMVDSLVDADQVDVEAARQIQQESAEALEGLDDDEANAAQRADLEDALARAAAQLEAADRK